jgi:tellurite resistance protein TehA-like permease
MILGLIGGITYFVGGGAGAVSWGEGTAPWWMLSLIPIGVLGAMGAMVVRTKPSLGGAIMLLAALGALGVGFASYNDYAGDPSISHQFASVILPVHPFMGSLMYAPVPLLTLIIGGVLALSSGKKTGADD